MRVTDLPTPQVLIDRSKLLGNIERMQSSVAARGLQLRPHAKTHKIPAIARWQIERGASGICCAKPGEAEVFADAGIEDIRLPYPVHPSNSDRILALMRRARISIIVDHLEVAREWSDAMQRAGERLDVLVKVDVGFHRCGIDPDHPSAAGFIRAIAGMSGLRLRGLLSHAGHGYNATSEEGLMEIAAHEANILGRLAAAARADGIAIDEISVGATPTARFSLEQPGLTEMRPGNYVYYDRAQVGLGAANLDECALTVLARVVSKPALNRIILDCGSKTLSSDQARGFGGAAAGYGAVLTEVDTSSACGPVAIDASLFVERLSEEHATVRVLGGATPLEPGDRVRVLPNHACVVSNLVDCVRLIEGFEVVDTFTVAARGKIA